MKLIKTIFLLSLLITSHLTGQDLALRKQIEKIIKYDLGTEVKEVPGFIVGIIDEEKTYVEIFGHVPETKIELKKDDCFEIGNISKAVAYEVTTLLEQQNKVKINTKINDFLPEKYQNPRLNQLVLSNLLSIENVLPNIIPGLGLNETEGVHPYGHIINDDLLTVYRDFVRKDDDLTNIYSNSDYGLLQICLENALKQDFQTMINETVNNHLDAGFFYTKFEQEENIVTPGIKRSGVVGKHWNVHNFAAALGLKSTISDMLQFARYKIEKHKSLSTEDWEKLHESLPETWNPQVKSFEGLYMVKINNHQKLLASNGHSDIHGSFLAVSPLTKTAVVVLSNTAAGTQDLGMLIMRMINNNWKRKSYKNVK